MLTEEKKEAILRYFDYLLSDEKFLSRVMTAERQYIDKGYVDLYDGEVRLHYAPKNVTTVD